LKFCIVERDPDDERNVATCCHKHQYCCPDASSDSKMRCVDLMKSSDFCGSCFTRCHQDQTCVKGLCQCPGGKKLCREGCVDTRSDERNCRECGTKCPPGWTCCTSDCVDTKTNHNHCDRCGHRCADGLECCNGVCTDTNSNVLNCGECGRPCQPDRLCCGGFCYKPSEFTCCPDGAHACGTNAECFQDQDGIWGCRPRPE
jgi:hypothetical protein